MTVQTMSQYDSEYPYTRIPNAAINDRALDLKAKGLLLLMRSKPPQWRFTEKNLASEAGVGRAQVRSAMATLIEAGYVKREAIPQDEGPPRWHTTVADCPVFGNRTMGEAPMFDYPTVGKPDSRETEPHSKKFNAVKNEQCSKDVSDPSGTDLVSVGEDRSEPPTIDTPLTEASAEGWQEAKALAEYLADAMVESGGAGTKRPNVTRKWVQTMELLVRLDERTPEQVRNAIDWCHRGAGANFWSVNILSPGKLREQYERLRRQAMRDGSTPRQDGRAKVNGRSTVVDMEAYGRHLDSLLAHVDD